MRFLVAMMLLVFMMPIAHATLVNSTNYKTIVILDEGGGIANKTSYKIFMTADSVLGLSNSSAQKVCIGFVCVEITPGGEVIVTFLLETNVSGTSGDTAFVSVDNTTGLYRARDITKFYICLQDTNLASSPVIGVIFAGANFNYARLEGGSSFVLRLSQTQPGNKFILPVTSGGCDTISSNYPIVFPIAPFVATADIIKALELVVEYPIDLIGDFERTGAFTLLLERNETEIVGVPV